MKKFIFITLMCIFPLVLLFIPKAYAKSYSSEYLDKINLVANVSKTSSSYSIYLSSNSVSGGRLDLQMFTNDGNTLYNSVNSSPTLTYRYYGVLSDNTTTSYSMSKSSNYAYANVNSSFVSISYIYISWSSGVSSQVPDFVFNVTYNTTSNDYLINSFVPNTYYNVGGNLYMGVFDTYKINLVMQYSNSSQDITSQCVHYNSFMFKYNSSIRSMVANNNNSNTYQYYLVVDFESYLYQMPNFKTSFLAIDYIWINNVRYDYATAISNFSWLGSNVVLYNDNATLFNDGYKSTANNLVINKIQFRIADNTFKSSSYYNSNLGISGYISSTALNVSELNGNDLYNMGLSEGYREGLDTGYLNGYNEGYSEGYGNENSLFDMFSSIADVPLKIIDGVLNFEILGVNLKGFFFGIITLILFVGIFRRFKE